ncbi:MAG: ComEC/Rec2 family competence protein [Eubacteriales bacterium]|nr:ComEC/Rec2 family competence protein [Eubacteriales bacterium]
MRRPLFGALAGIAAAVWLTIILFPLKLPDYEPYRGSRVTLTGTVCSLEPKLEGDTTVWRLMLSEVLPESDDTGPGPGAGLSGTAAEEDRILPAAGNPSAAAEPQTAVQPSGGTGAAQPLSSGPGQDLGIGKNSRVLCVLEREPALDLSARVRIRGKVTPFRGAMNEGEFDVRFYYHILRVDFSLRDAEIIAASAPADHLAASLFQFKKYISKVIDRVFSTQNAPVLQAMLLGEKGLLEEETKELYQGAGIIHILSISGLHLSLLGMGFFSLLGKLRLLLPVRENRKAAVLWKKIPMGIRAAASILLVFLYGKMTGMGTSAFRALVMLSLFIISKVIGRTYDLLTAAAVACVLLLFDQPLYLLHTGFRFSFAAVLSMGILLPAVPGRALKAAAVPLGTLPVYLWAYGTFPLWSLLLNLVVIPLMGAVMLSGGAAVLLGAAAGMPFCSAASDIPLRAAAQEIRFHGIAAAEGAGISFRSLAAAGEGISFRGAASAGTAGGFFHVILEYASRLAAIPAEGILNLYRLLAVWTQKLPGHTLVPGRPSPLRILLYYGMLLALTAISVHLRMPAVRRRIEHCTVHDFSMRVPFGDFIMRVPFGTNRLWPRDNRERRRIGTACSAVWILLSVFVLAFRCRIPFEMDFLYVGQGDGIVITCDGRYFLIDGGSSSKDQLAGYTLLPFLHCRGIGHLDGVIITHEDGDHCSGLLEILENAVDGSPDLPIGTIYLPDIAENSKGEKYRRIESLAAEAGIPVQHISRGQRLRTGELCLDCLHPKAGALYSDANETSLTFLLRYREFSALLTGDLEGEGEAEMLRYVRQTLTKDAEPLRVNLLKAAHHGSRNATSPEFLQCFRPDCVVISAGINNLYGHPHRELLERLQSLLAEASVFRTDLQGEIRMQWRRKGAVYNTWIE